jgi:hypothetical protein
MTEFWTSVISSLRKPPISVLLALGLLGLLLLTSPESLLVTLGLSEFTNSYRPWMGLTTLTAWFVLATTLLCWLGKTVIASWKSHRRQCVRIRHLRELTTEEKVLLRPYIADGENSRIAGLGDGVTGGLAAKGILFRATNVAPWGDFPYNLQPWARRYLTKHPELLA